ncbi:MAG: keto-deoxy-phosphogluconate aldolase [Marinomonas sp.]|jgi:2-dehydro-3-deoxyphosphogluconate aldolase/(4S)-4-hydroxy-2-oxoglutarate aldolase|uniref:2-dehydro-3-deoxy-phosphogluconate aldolase n=2 Tax=Marinomonas TaxID=28253 RepID=A0A4R6X579_9GAMM|nr:MULTISPECIES: bifunctional 4-hydroxy-2-oxoglutarate aldolase/2-dehydro-3-deoxy-phosphogluconate aldolase [Marinomonas]MAF16312.1 keto-deoxy-phosphogluconate aldolase [Marinomonas sp.]MEC8080430.1 bifunctional 4-hydroxy-2-oxoglutarate aldolase/2-dehydro-3-deoxy-phosphogluconate aldolase [Pseudomonadota bacterium]MBJ7549829.1 bifunctional 4-hydroxy-2-oxoglutarate aldolase/2-dehydro-3-deoxy-phosphogluconate aldolase [Marinomonas ostreistagni]MCC4273194.1 bifunctional 4-hydroxy-2-oxoglutarate al
MTTYTAAQVMTATPVVPVIVVDDVEQAVNLGKALVAGGVPVLEVTLRTEAALEAITALRKEVPEAIVGAGTVCSREQYIQAVEAGSQFIISPGLTPDLLKVGKEYDIPYLPAVATISDILLGLEYGYDHFKFFPAEVNGGVKALKAFSGPLPQIRFCPTGGINEKNFKDYLALDSVLCVGGSWIVPTDLVKAGKWDEITELAKSVQQ